MDRSTDSAMDRTVLRTVVLSVLNSTDSTSGHFFMTCTVHISNVSYIYGGFLPKYFFSKRYSSLKLKIVQHHSHFYIMQSLKRKINRSVNI